MSEKEKYWCGTMHEPVIASVAKQSRKIAWIASALLLLAMTVFPHFTALAEDNAPAFLTPAQIAPHQKTIDRVTKYLSGLSTIVADFTQVAPDATLTSGKFFLKRPGRMRWQYNPPTPVLMIANGSEFVYYDYELEQVTYVPLDSALVGFLAQKTIAFDDKVGIIHFEEENGAIRISMAQRDKPTEGQLMLEFSDKPLFIRNMVVTDASNQRTTVALSNAKFGVALDKRLFVFLDPRKGRGQPLGGTVLNQ